MKIMNFVREKKFLGKRKKIMSIVLTDTLDHRTPPKETPPCGSMHDTSFFFFLILL